MNLRELKLNKSFSSVINDSQLKIRYQEVCKKLEKDFNNEMESQTTQAEKKFAEILRQNTKLKFHQNVWIGKRNVDLLFSNIKGKKEHYHFRGIVFEIDGSIHNKEFKIKKDETLAKQLFKFNLLLKTVLNEDLKHSTLSSDLKELLTYPRMNTRERTRLWRNIYIYTIYKCCTLSEMEVFFGTQGANYIQKIGRLHEK